MTEADIIAREAYLREVLLDIMVDINTAKTNLLTAQEDYHRTSDELTQLAEARQNLKASQAQEVLSLELTYTREEWEALAKNANNLTMYVEPINTFGNFSNLREQIRCALAALENDKTS